MHSLILNTNLHLMATQTDHDQLPQQTPCISRANLIKAKSSVPAVNCYLWGSFFFLYFFLKLLATFKSTLTLEMKYNRLMNSHLWQILCKQPVNWICDQVFPYQGHMVLASVLYPFLSCKLSFTTPSITAWNVFSRKRKFCFFFLYVFSDLKRFYAATGIQSKPCNCGQFLGEGGLKWLWVDINLLLDYAG